MEAFEVVNLFQPIWADIDLLQTFPHRRPHLAHYTSISALEEIVKNDEFWFSNPLNMNDWGELRFGVLGGVEAFRTQRELILSACGDSERYEIFSRSFEIYFEKFNNNHAFDTYVFCFSEHAPENTDGRLSMWRGYGGNGSGAAIVIDTNQINHLEGVQPLVISKVEYLSDAKRHEWINQTLIKFASILKENKPPKELLNLAAHNLFERFKIFALFSKHCGFEEEGEWRVAYLKERDVSNVFSGMFGYANTVRGIETKLKFKIRPLKGFTADDLSLEKIVSNIILGPTHSSPLATAAVRRMLEVLGRPELAKKVIGSTIPFRT